MSFYWSKEDVALIGDLIFKEEFSIPFGKTHYKKMLVAFQNSADLITVCSGVPWFDPVANADDACSIDIYLQIGKGQLAVWFACVQRMRAGQGRGSLPAEIWDKLESQVAFSHKVQSTNLVENDSFIEFIDRLLVNLYKS